MVGFTTVWGGLSALRQSRLFECDDIDEAHDRIASILQPHRLLPLGAGPRMPNHMDVITLPGLRVGGLGLGHSRVEVPALDDYHLLMFCLSGQANVQSGGEIRAIHTRYAVSREPGQSFVGEFSDDCEQLVVRIDTETMRTHTGRRHTSLPPIIDLTTPALQPWLSLLRNLTDSPELLRLLKTDHRIARNYEGLLLDLLLSAFDDTTTQKDKERGPILPASVRRADAFIVAHALEAITLGDIARAAGTPARTLLDAFKRFCATTPMNRLREVRLDLARDRLRKSNGRTVADIALECGFGHLGRFAAHYARQFGERPSETVRKAGGL